MNNLLKFGDIRKFTYGKNEITAVVIGIDEGNRRYNTITTFGDSCTIDFGYDAKVVKLDPKLRSLLSGIANQLKNKKEHEECIKAIDNNIELARKKLFDISYKPNPDGLPF